MQLLEFHRLLRGVVGAVDAVLGGMRKGKPRRSSPGKRPFLAVVELDDEGIRGACASMPYAIGTPWY